MSCIDSAGMLKFRDCYQAAQHIKEWRNLMRIRRENDMADADIEFIANVSDAFAHPVRLQLFRYIMQVNKEFKTICNKDLVAEFGYAQATISQHMKKLVDAGLIETKKNDKFTYYYASLGVLMKYVKLTKQFSVV